jgi:hypothetical protein
MIVGIVYSRSVALPKIAEYAPIKEIQLESQVERFERLLVCNKFVPLEVLKPITAQILKFLSRTNKQLIILMDRSLIEHKLNVLHLAVAFGARALPLGWLRVEGKGTSGLELQKKLLSWLKEILPKDAEVFIVADREFHSIFLAEWIKEQMNCHFVLRIQSNTYVEVKGEWKRADSTVSRGGRSFYSNLLVTRYRKATYRVNLAAIWSKKEDEPWLIISDLKYLKQIESIYAKRFWIEEMFSDHKSRGLNLEQTRITDPDRLERLLVAVAIAYLWIMQVGTLVVNKDLWRQVDNRGKSRTVSLCRIGLRWLTKLFTKSIAPPLFTCRFHELVVPCKT